MVASAARVAVQAACCQGDRAASAAAGDGGGARSRPSREAAFHSGAVLICFATVERLPRRGGPPRINLTAVEVEVAVRKFLCIGAAALGLSAMVSEVLKVANLVPAPEVCRDQLARKSVHVRGNHVVASEGGQVALQRQLSNLVEGS